MKAMYFKMLSVGVVVGFFLSRIGFSDWQEVRHMFLLQDPRLWVVFMGAVALLLIPMWVIQKQRGRYLGRRPIHPGSIPGGVLFGAGWAITGACPGVALVQIGEGQLPALATLAGIAVGAAVYLQLHRRIFRWDRGDGCVQV